MEIVKYLSLDPGESTGWATFRKNGSLVEFGTIRGKEALYHFLEAVSINISTIILEDYHLFPHKSNAQAWSSLNTVRYIGAVDYWAETTGRRVVLQDPSVKAMAYKWAGIEIPKRKSDTHETDAYVHGVYYLQKLGIRKPQQGKARAK